MASLADLKAVLESRKPKKTPLHSAVDRTRQSALSVLLRAIHPNEGQK